MILYKLVIYNVISYYFYPFFVVTISHILPLTFLFKKNCIRQEIKYASHSVTFDEDVWSVLHRTPFFCQIIFIQFMWHHNDETYVVKIFFESFCSKIIPTTYSYKLQQIYCSFFVYSNSPCLVDVLRKVEMILYVSKISCGQSVRICIRNCT